MDTAPEEERPPTPHRPEAVPDDPKLWVEQIGTAVDRAPAEKNPLWITAVRPL